MSKYMPRLENLKYNLINVKSIILKQIKRIHDLHLPQKTENRNVVKNKFKTNNNKKVTNSNTEPYEWRGLHIDVARHMMPVEYLMRTLDKMATLGLNRLHLHLTDDQGWRFESKHYPRLHTVGGYRRETVLGKQFPFFNLNYKGDGIRYGGYYKQDELKELVKYAKDKGIIIVPEIDIPGHATALLSAYPEYAYSKAPTEVATYWGVFDNVLANNERTLEFINIIFDELMEVFDSKYIHIGGDEVSVAGYDSEYILLGVAQHLKSKGRTPIVWDEAYSVAAEVGGIVMVWRNMSIVLDMLKKGLPTICASSTHFYFDHYQSADINNEPLAIGGYTDCDRVLSAAAELGAIKIKAGTNADKLIGVQAQLWTEYIRNSEEADYMLYPRLEAFAQVAGRGAVV